ARPGRRLRKAGLGADHTGAHGRRERLRRASEGGTRRRRELGSLGGRVFSGPAHGGVAAPERSGDPARATDAPGGDRGVRGPGPGVSPRVPSSVLAPPCISLLAWPRMRYAAWTEVNFDAFTANIRALRSILGPSRRILLVVKADAYGHGAVEVSVAAEK